MITNIRRIDESDRAILDKSLSEDEFHSETTEPDFFYEDGSICNVYEDEKGPVLFLRGSKALRIDIQFLDNHDSKRNAATMIEGFNSFAERAKDAGFTELIFNTSSKSLARFCKKYLQFIDSEGELRRFI